MESDVSSPIKHTDTPSKGIHNIEMMCSPISCARSKTPGSSTKKLGRPLMMSSPSPAHKLPGASTRNELYLKSVLSPYNKNYTPLSATPTGMTPMFRTPGRSVHSSPIVREIPDGVRHLKTPQRVGPKNPFEFDVEHLEGNVFMSPGVFSMAGSTPASDEKKAFRWSIEHLAVLHPADIDEMPHQQDPHHGHDKETEEKAQRAIDTFFKNNLVVPSPAPGTNNYTKGTPASGKMLGCLHEELQGSIQKQLPTTAKTDTKKEASCQTVLSLPVDFDINKLLGQYIQNHQTQEDNQEMLSTSSLRRKLFFQGDNSTVAPSPVKGDLGKDKNRLLHDPCASPSILPSKTPQKDVNKATPLKTPSRNHFSSSPIKNVKDLRTPLFKRTPEEDFLDNLDFSPIVHGHMSRVRSSGLFNPHDGSFVEEHCSPAKEEHLARPLEDPDLSPIRPAVLLKNPSISNSASKPSFHSPGVSPIAVASPVASPAHDGSFIQTHHECSPVDSDEDMKTPMPADVNEEKLKKAESCRKVSTLGRHRQRNIFPEFDDTAMDFEPVPVHKNLRFADVDDIKTSSLLVNRESSFTDMEFTNDHATQPSSTSQDTGYQTTSLQLTNQDTGTGCISSLTNNYPVNSTSIMNPDVHNGRPSSICPDVQHTNLTAQFGSMPTNSFYFEGDSVLDCNDYPLSTPKEHLVNHILDITNPEKFGHAPYSEEEILERARKVLQLANEMFPESNINKEREVQDICDKTGLSTLYELEPIVSPNKEVRVPFSSASEQAMEILRRAGEDLAKFGHLLSSIKSSAEKSILSL